LAIEKPALKLNLAVIHNYIDMNEKWPHKFSYKNSNSLLRYLQNTAWDYFYLQQPVC